MQLHRRVENNRKIRVLFIQTMLSGGARTVLNVLRNLDPAKFQPTLFVLKPPCVYKDELADSTELIMGTEHEGRLRYRLGGIFSRLMRASANHDIIVGALELDATYLAYIADRLNNRPVIGWVHTTLAEYLKLRQRWHEPLVRAIYPRLDRVVFVSTGAAASIREMVRLNNSRVEVIPNSLDPTAVEMVERMAQSWKAPASTSPIVMAVGRLNPEKGFDLLIRAHRRLRDAGTEHSLVILGEGPLRGELMRLAEQLQVADTVAMPGHLVNPYSSMKQATVIVVPSRFEGFGMVLLEAFVLGVPILSTTCPSGPSEILDSGRYGCLVPPNDDAALAEAIGRLLSDPAKRQQLSEAGRARVRRYYPANIVPCWEHLFTEILYSDGRRNAGFLVEGANGISLPDENTDLYRLRRSS